MYLMQCIILTKTPVEFTGKKGELVKGYNLNVLRSNDLQVKRYFCTPEKLQKIGFKDSMVANPFEDGEMVVTEGQFDENTSGKIVPTQFKA